jgi:hypothetical protein
MLKRFFSTIFGAAFSFAVIAVPAHAADDIEVKVQVCAACHGQNEPFRSFGVSSRAISSSNCTTTEVAIAKTRSCHL